MTDYKQLAARYLKSNKARSAITILGVVLTSMVLYIGLNLMWSWFLNQRDVVRKNGDYEMVIITEDDDVKSQIVSDERVARVYLGDYSRTEIKSGDVDTNGNNRVEYEEVLYKDCLYVALQNPYKFVKIKEDFENTYDVVIDENYELTALYFVNNENAIIILILFVLLISFIFAIFAVGVVRNTVQMFAMEQVKDYGILRCIGSTKGQLRAVIYYMGFALECTGLVIGILAGQIVCTLVSAFAGYRAGFHLVVVGMVLLVYLGDLIFAMSDITKMVVNMPPISAVRGQFRIKKEKLKIRHKGLMGLIFGLEGEYARKSVLRNKGRFIKAVLGMAVSATAFVAVFSVWAGVKSMIDIVDAGYGTYQVTFGDPSFVDIGDANPQAYLPAKSMMEKWAAKDYVEKTRFSYMTTLAVTDDNLDRYSDDFLNNTYIGSYFSEKFERRNEDGDSGVYAEALTSFIAYGGYSEEEKKELEARLIEGTLDVSENGIVVVSYGTTEYINKDESDDDVTLYDQKKHIQISNLKVGDKINLVDPKIYRERLQQRYQEILYREQNTNYYDEEGTSPLKDKLKALTEVKKELIAEGYTNDYTVEGVLDNGDLNTPDVIIYTPLDNYFELTGLTTDDFNMYSVAFDTKKLMKKGSSEVQYLYDSLGDDEIVSETSYFESIILLAGIRTGMMVILAIAFFIFVVSAINIINTTGGNLHMRRKEFAQLRVIGMSKNRLIKMVMLEGLMVTVLATIIGTAVGTSIYMYVYKYVKMLFDIKFTLSWVAILLTAILIGSVQMFGIFIPLKKLPNQMAEDLAVEE